MSNLWDALTPLPINATTIEGETLPQVFWNAVRLRGERVFMREKVFGGPEATRPGGFGEALQTALRQVNESQARASAMTEAYERGETTDIAAVMLSRQQASLGFEATLQVRNRLLTAYKDIMSMPV